MFFLISMPAMYVIAYRITGDDYREYLADRVFFKGFMASPLAILLVHLLRDWFRDKPGFVNEWLYHWGWDLLLPVLAANAAYAIVYREAAILDGIKEIFRRFAFVAGVFTGLVLSRLIFFGGAVDTTWDLILLPLVWMALQLPAAYYVSRFFQSKEGSEKVVITGLFLLTLLLLALPAGLYRSNFHLLAYALLPVIAGAVNYLGLAIISDTSGMNEELIDWAKRLKKHGIEKSRKAAQSAGTALKKVIRRKKPAEKTQDQPPAQQE